MTVLLRGTIVFMLMFSMALFAGQNENASISVDFNYDQAGNQGINSIDAPGTDIKVLFEIRVDNCSQFDTYFFEVLYSTEDLTFDKAWTDNDLGDDGEENILKRLGAGVIDAPIEVDESGAVGKVIFSRTNDTNDPAFCPSGEGLIALFRFVTKVDAPRSIQFGRVEWYDVDGVMDLCTEDNKGEGFMGGGSLPVELSAFTARVVNDAPVLQWTTESEKESWGFNILRSTAQNRAFRRVNAEIIKGAGTKTTRTHYSYTDRYELEAGATYFYQLEQLDVNGARTLYGPIELTLSSDDAQTPDQFVLYDNYPNPFNPQTTIKFEIPEDAFITVDIYNIAGSKIRTLVNSPYKAGEHTATWDGRNDNGDNVSSGTYLYKFRAGAFGKNGKMMLLN